MRKFGIAVLGLVVVSLGVWALPLFPPPSIVADVVRVIDGDTIEVKIVSLGGVSETGALKVGTTLGVRYIGADTPETKAPGVPVQCFGPEADAFNEVLVLGRTVYLELDEGLWDSFGRLLAYVYLDTDGHSMVNLTLVALGYARVDFRAPNNRYESIFNAVQATARSQCLGLWRHCERCEPTARTCADCLRKLEDEMKAADFTRLYGVDDAFALPLERVSLLVSPCALDGIISALAKVVSTTGKSTIGRPRAEIIVRQVCPWLFCGE